MLTDSHRLTETVIEKLLVEASNMKHPVETKTPISFIRQYFKGLPANDIENIGPDDLTGCALTHWQLAKKRTQTEVLIRVFNPEQEKHGWQSSHTIVQIVSPNLAFLVDSMTMALNQLGLTIHLTIHPLINIIRDENGIAKGIDDGEIESFMQFQIDKQASQEKLDWIKQQLRNVFDDICNANNDWQPMREKAKQLHATIDEIGHNNEEAVSFLAWINESSFTYAGYCYYKLNQNQLIAEHDTGLGILKNQDSRFLSQAVPSQSTHFATLPDLVNVTKSALRSTIHRVGHLDLISVPQFDNSGNVAGKHCFLGLFTTTAYSNQTADIPLLRYKTKEILRLSGALKGSHNAKVLTNIIETFPRNELFQFSTEELITIFMGIVDLQERQRVRLFGRVDPNGHFCSCQVYIPRDKYGRELRLKIQSLLTEATNATHVDFDTHFSSNSTLARINYVLQTNKDNSKAPDWDKLESSISEAARGWNESLQTEVLEHFGEANGVTIFNRYASAFPSSYKEDFSARVGCLDIEYMESLAQTGSLPLSFYRPITGSEKVAHFKIFSAGNFIPLSDILPVLENMGFKVDGERPYQIKRENAEPVWIHEFSLRAGNGSDVDPEIIGDNFKEAFANVWTGKTENDGFNSLVLNAGLTSRNAATLRCYSRYLRQIGLPFSLRYIIGSLTTNANITKEISGLFQARFNPAFRGNRESEIESISQRISEGLEHVSSLDEDRILRGFAGLVNATLRTNYFQLTPDGQHKDYISFKFDPSQIEGMPEPKPKYEIFVCSPRFEAVHLRGGSVARGGLRWSDRREDFRTEILGLVKAQMVKNAVIVPVGSKGGFVLKQPPTEGGREAFMAEGIACYQNFLRGLLDITDNISGQDIIAPENVVRYDGNDPYLVVAADKGTATFSDFANAVSEEYGFWLGDAFASGGSNGYDHKGMGITARGAWESVKRHFRELGLDTQNEDFTVVGVGDMGGDVFGNGMLLSEHIRLVGAFNHLHIFFDPTPDAASTFKERQRLFETPRTTWEDFDKSLISKGGGIFSRNAKSIDLSPEMQKALDTDITKATPNELINLMLKAPVDLLWNGGIGTYIKHSSETHAEAADRSNDATRVSGNEVRARVIGEGGNLGVTQRARIELAHNNVLCYTDAVDNSAGVDCSDHEVNIKILLDQVVQKGDMTDKQRNELLAEMTDEVGLLVLKDNYQQTQCISRLAAHASSSLEEHSRFIEDLEERNLLNREIEFLPNKEEISDRLADHKGMTRAELSVIVSYAKMTQFDDVVASDLPESEYLSGVPNDYFPKVLGERYSTEMASHRLRREIIATVITNEFVNRCGPCFAQRMSAELGAGTADSVKAYIASRDIFDMNRLWTDIEELDNKISAHTQIEMHVLVTGLVARATHWMLRHRRTAAIDNTVDYFKGKIEQLTSAVSEALADENTASQNARTQYFIGKGVPQELAERAAMVVPLSSALDIVEIAEQANANVSLAADVHFNLGSRLDLQWLRDEIQALRITNQWHGLAKSRLRTEVHTKQRELAAQVLSCSKGNDAESLVNDWMRQKASSIHNYERIIHDMKGADGLDFAMLSLAVNEASQLLMTNT